MLNKILLACCGGTVERELFARVRITVGNSGAGQIGYRLDQYGSLEIIEGSLTIKRLYSSGSNNDGFSYCYTDASDALIEFRNETTGQIVVMNKTNYVEDDCNIYNAAKNIFLGVSEGQSCVIGLYA